jgi:hypothetical protein
MFEYRYDEKRRCIIHHFSPGSRVCQCGERKIPEENFDFGFIGFVPASRRSERNNASFERNQRSGVSVIYCE